MGRFEVKNEEKTPSDANKKLRGFGSGNTVWREAFSGTSGGLNVLQVKFNCGEGNEGGRFWEYLKVTTTYLSTKIEGGGDVKTLIRNGKVFEPAWLDPVGPTPVATNAMLQALYGTRAKRVDKLRINLSTAYGLVPGQCAKYLRSRTEEKDKWETTSNEWDLLKLLKIVKYLSHKYD